jgi:hypothetical protein
MSSLKHVNNIKRPRTNGFMSVSRCQEPNTRCIRLTAQTKAPSDFFLFKYTNGKISDYNCERWENLLNAITEIFSRVDQEILLSVFESRANRLKFVIKH